jgi:hypothetical protein
MPSLGAAMNPPDVLRSVARPILVRNAFDATGRSDGRMATVRACAERTVVPRRDSHHPTGTTRRATLNGLVALFLVELPDTALREVRDRIRSAIVN